MSMYEKRYVRRYKSMSPELREEIIAKAVREAEIAEILKNKTWYVEARVGSENFRGAQLRFIDNSDQTVNLYVEEYIAGLLLDNENLKAEITELKSDSYIAGLLLDAKHMQLDIQNLRQELEALKKDM